MTKNKKVYITYQIIIGLVYIAMLVIFSYMSLRTGTQSTQDSTVVGDVVADVVENTTPIVIDKTPNYYAFIRKFIGHYGYFVGLGIVSFFFYDSFKKLKFYFRWLIHFAAGFLFAFITEYVFQMNTVGRGPSMVDTMIDFGGFCTLSLVIAIVFYFVFYLHKKKPKLENNKAANG